MSPSGFRLPASRIAAKHGPMPEPRRTLWERLGLDQWMRDLRYAARSLRRAPGFSLAVFGTLAVCIGPNAATLSALYALVLKPLPFADSGQLVAVLNVAEKNGGQRVLSSFPQYRDFKAHADLFSAFGLVLHQGGTLNEETAPSRVQYDLVTTDFFPLLGSSPLLGRFFDPGEAVAGRDQVLVLSQSFWESHYAADPGVIGRTVRLDDRPCVIVGVAPRALASLNATAALFRPYVPQTSRLDPQYRYRGEAALYARLKPDAAPGAALAQLKGLEADFLRTVASPLTRTLVASAGYKVAIEPLRAGGATGGTEPLWLLQGGALLVLLIGCTNVTNLFLARMNAKRPELATRVALGAGRAALLRQTLSESLLLTGSAAAAGVALAAVALRVFNRYLALMGGAAPAVALDGAVIGTMAAVAAGIAVLVGLLPLQFAWRAGLRGGDSRTASAGGGARRVSAALVTFQVAVAVVLLVGAGLLLRSFAKVMAVDPGFDAARVATARIALPARYDAPAGNVATQQRILDALRGIAGTETVAQSFGYGLGAVTADARPVPFGVRGGPSTGEQSQQLIHIQTVSPEFFAVMGMRVVSGRGFTEADDFLKHKVCLVDQAFAERYFRGRIVEGQEIYLSAGLPVGGPDAWPRIVGVVSRADLTGLDSRDHLPFVFVPDVAHPMRDFNVYVRSRRPAPDLLREMRAAVHGVDPAVLFYGAGTLEEELDGLLDTRRGITLLLGVFSGLALLVAAIGLYGMLSYDVSQRSREIGIRGAIGASSGQIVGLIMRQGLARTAGGMAAGLIGAVLLSHYLGTLLFGVAAADPVSYLGVLALLAVVAGVASWLPARRASRIDPVVVLRAE